MENGQILDLKANPPETVEDKPDQSAATPAVIDSALTKAITDEVLKKIEPLLLELQKIAEKGSVGGAAPPPGLGALGAKGLTDTHVLSAMKNRKIQVEQALAKIKSHIETVSQR